MAILYVYSGAAGSGSGADWTNAKTTLTAAFTTEVAGDTLYVAHDHAESTATAITLTSSGTPANLTKIICVDRAGTVPPVAADRRATAQVSTTLASSITLGGSAHYDGVIFNAGVGTASGVNITVGNTTNSYNRLDNCSLRIASTSTSSGLQIGNATNGGTLVEWNNTTLSHASVGQAVTCTCVLRWRNTLSALLGSIPTTLFSLSAARGSWIECSGVDLSAMGSGKNIVDSTSTQGATVRFVDCKLDAAVTKQVTIGAPGGTDSDYIRCGAAGTNYTVYRARYSAVLTEETTIVRTGGASDGTTPIAWKIITTANSSYSLPFECPPIAIWNDTTSSAVTATVEGIWGGGAVPLDSEIWVDVEYLGDASSPQGSFVNDGMANLLAGGANQTASSATWGGSTTKFKLNVTFTAQQKGWIYARVKCAKASSTFYVDPLVTLT